MQLHTRTTAALPETPAEERGRIAAGPTDPGTHERVAGAIPALACVELAPPPAQSACPSPARVVAWNAERGARCAGAAAMLEALGADALLLSELDVGMARSAQRHTARELSRALGCGYAFGLEFLELGLGAPDERQRHDGEANRVGHHGGAVLSPHAMERAALVRLDAGGDWFGGERGEPRVGGRIAVLATLRVGGAPVTLASLHLESHAGPERRDRQVAALLDALERWSPDAPVLIGGDFNTHGLPLEALLDRAVLRRELRADPDRLRAPIGHEPLFARLERAGFDWHACNRVGESTERRKTPSERGALKLDWFFARGLRCSAPEVVAAADPRTGEALSDHEAIATTIAPA